MDQELSPFSLSLRLSKNKSRQINFDGIYFISLKIFTGKYNSNLR